MPTQGCRADDDDDDIAQAATMISSFVFVMHVVHVFELSSVHFVPPNVHGRMLTVQPLSVRSQETPHPCDRQLTAALPPTLLMPGLRRRHVATLQHKSRHWETRHVRGVCNGALHITFAGLNNWFCLPARQEYTLTSFRRLRSLWLLCSQPRMISKTDLMAQTVKLAFVCEFSRCEPRISPVQVYTAWRHLVLSDKYCLPYPSGSGSDNKTRKKT